MPASLGFIYERDGYDTSGKRLLGRQAAGEAFLKSLLKHTRIERLYCVARNAEQYKDCVDRARAWQFPRKISYLAADDPSRIREAGVVYRPDPALGDMAWLRRFAGQRDYSLCGVTHTICTKNVMTYFGHLATAPVQPWDALICTSTAVKRVVEQTLAEYCDYLAVRCGAKPVVPVQLPIIPLGIDAASFARSPDTKIMRAGLRKALEIGDEDIVVLYVGRLNYYAKAHPIPMYLAVEQAARTTGKKVHLLQVGWFEQEKEEKAFKESAEKFCPGVNCLFMDGRRPEVRRQAWASGDIFVSLSDNIQETFGLTPLEAMAAGLPVICTDWDGYQETVRHEIDGFRIPIFAPPPGSGVELARDYLSDRLPYNGYVGRASQSTAADIDAVTRSLVTLINQPQLREKMGAAGETWARQEYDWPVIIRRYEALWDELAALRSSVAELVPLTPGTAPNPLNDDPFRAFAQYTDRHLHPDLVIGLGQCSSIKMLEALFVDPMVSLGNDRRLKPEEFAVILKRLRDSGPQPLSEFLTSHPGQEATVYRTIGWLLKFDMARVVS